MNAARRSGERAPVVLLAATSAELGPLLEQLGADRGAGTWPRTWRARGKGRELVLAETGVGVAAAAGATALLAERHRPAGVVQLGIAGAYVGSFVPVGAAVCAESEFLLDAGIIAGAETRSLAEVPLPLATDGPGGPPLYERLPTDPAWREILARACGMAPVAFATSDGVSGDLDVAAARAERSGAAVESMEGAGAALVCARLGLPFAEVRGISNVAGQREKEAWEPGRAVAAATEALSRALVEVSTA